MSLYSIFCIECIGRVLMEASSLARTSPITVFSKKKKRKEKKEKEEREKKGGTSVKKVEN